MSKSESEKKVLFGKEYDMISVLKKLKINKKKIPLPSELTHARRHIIRKIKRGEVQQEEEYKKLRSVDDRMVEFEEKRKK